MRDILTNKLRYDGVSHLTETSHSSTWSQKMHHFQLPQTAQIDWCDLVRSTFYIKKLLIF